MLELPRLPDDLPWPIPAYLLLDGVSASSLVQGLHRWDNHVYHLYQGTRWNELADISPLLISLKGVDDPLLAYFQEHAALEGGYLLFSDVDVQALCKHWRRLLTVQHPGGVEVMLRIADPAVMHQLLDQADSTRWFGPVQHVCLPDALLATWLQHQRPEQTVPVAIDVYRLTEAELTALGEAEFRHAVFDLNHHLQRYFPRFMASHSAHERLGYAHKLAQSAYRQGFASEQEITLYANVCAYLAGQQLASHPDIVELLTASTQPPLIRVQHAAKLAQERAIHL